MKNIIVCLALLGSVVLAQNYTNITTSSDSEPLSLQKISYRISNGVNVSNSVSSPLNVSIANTAQTNIDITFGGVTPSNATPLPVYSGQNFTTTNLLNIVTNAGVVGYCAWSCTNSVFRLVDLDGGSALLENITIKNATNQDYVIWVFDKVVTAPVKGTAWAPTMNDLQFCVARIATTNSAYGDWNLAGTNYVKTLGNLAISCQNKDASVNMHFIGTYLDTKTNYTTSAYIKVGALSD